MSAEILIALASAGLLIELEGSGADDFGQVAGGKTAEGVHLEEPVLGAHVALEKERVILAGSADVRDAESIESDRARGRDGGLDGPGMLGQWPPRVSIDQREDDYQSDGDRNIDDAKKAAESRSIH